MKAILYDKKNANGRLSYTDVKTPHHKEHEILVEVHAASLNAADYRLIQMGFPPKKKIFGADISGLVVSVGKQVTKFKPGDHVVGDLSDFGFGGFSEFVSAPEIAFVHKPVEISFEDAAALPLSALTALQALIKGGIKKDDEVLLLGCSGGVGIYALQLAKYFGAVVTGVCSTRNVEQSRILGADTIIDYKKQNLYKIDQRFDLILAINGSYPLILCKKLLKPHGRYMMVGGTMGQIFKAIFFGWILSLGSKKMGFLSAKSNINDLELLLKLAVEGKIKPVIDKVFPLNQTADAFRYMKEDHPQGKVLIQIKQP
jgi:NADPH:quinone reductase-like Zn-dependent oxidoreductase